MNKYLLEALDAYPYDLAQAIESLGYALSYDEKCPHTLCLYGRVYAEQMQDYPTAIHYFEEALQCDLYAVKVYPPYIRALLHSGQYTAAKKAIDFALTLKGTDQYSILLLKSQYFEYLLEFDKALKALKESEMHIYRNDLKHFISETKSRIEAKKEAKKAENKDKRKK